MVFEIVGTFLMNQRERERGNDIGEKERYTDRQTNRQTDRQNDRRCIERIYSLSIF